MAGDSKITAGITIGDCNGIGPEIILKVLADSGILDLCTPVIYGSSAVLDHYRKALKIPEFSIARIADITELKKGSINLLECQSEAVQIEAGKSTSSAGKLALSALDFALMHIGRKQIDVMVTAPVNKKNIQQHRPDFTGHTGYLSGADGRKGLMVLCSEKLRIAMVTGHMSLADVPAAIDVEKITASLEALDNCMKRDFGIEKPKLAVLALNPHAGEEGLLGKEEKNTIEPAVSLAMSRGILASGPYPADGFFGSSAYRKFDAVLAMYHDQALIPFKALSFGGGVNFTGGLNFIRTSPDHGTAYEIAGKGIAMESSLRDAISTACDIYRRRLAQQESKLENA